MNTTQIDSAKNAIRERVWALLEKERAVPEPGVHGRIPDFTGAAAAAERLASLQAWGRARVIKAVPDKPQEPVRALALSSGRLVYMAVPKLADKLPFYLLDPRALSVPPAKAASKDVAARVATKVDVEDMLPVDLIICGSVAVNPDGTRLGKGAGYSDIEVALLQEAGLVSDETAIVTTVHPLQIINEPIPETAHDFRVDYIVTPDRTIVCGSPKRPAGLVWEHLTAETIASIPLLTARLRSRTRQGRN